LQFLFSFIDSDFTKQQMKQLGIDYFGAESNVWCIWNLYFSRFL